MDTRDSAKGYTVILTLLFANRSGGTGGDRTRDPNIKSVVLYQLSYSPGVEVAHSIPNCVRARNQIFPRNANVV